MNELKSTDATERGSEQQRNLAKLLQDANVPDLAIKLSRVYEFDSKPAGPTFRAVRPLHENSFLASSLHQWHDTGHRVPLSKKTSIELPPGVTIIMGRAGSGKTKLALGRMATGDAASYIRFGEPLDKYFAVSQAAGVALFAQSEVALANVIANFLFADETHVLIVDSLRYLMFGGSGATGKGGVNMTLFSDLSFLDTVAATRGKSLVIVINPMTDSAEAYSQLLEVAAGSVAAIVDVQRVDSVRFSSRYTDRAWSTYQLPDSLPSVSGSPQLGASIDAPSVNLKNFIA